MASYQKRNFVRETRLMDSTDDYSAMDKFEVKIPVYSVSLIDELNLKDVRPEDIKKIMSEQQPKNLIVKERPRVDGFKGLFEALDKTTTEYTNLAGCQVDVITIIRGDKVRFNAKVTAIDGLKVALTLDNDSIVMCSVDNKDAKTWLFN